MYEQAISSKISNINLQQIDTSHVNNIWNTFIVPEMFNNFRNVCGCIKVLEMSILRLGIFVKH